MEIKRILWPTDMSDVSAQAMPYVASIAEKYGAKVVVLHIMDEITRFERLAYALDGDQSSRIRKQLRGDANMAMEQLCKALGEKCPSYEKQVLEGDTADTILEFLQKEDFDLVVMATHGRGGLKRFNYGSVAERVMHNSPVPVLTVRAK